MTFTSREEHRPWTYCAIIRYIPLSSDYQAINFTSTSIPHSIKHVSNKQSNMTTTQLDWCTKCNSKRVSLQQTAAGLEPRLKKPVSSPNPGFQPVVLHIWHNRTVSRLTLKDRRHFLIERPRERTYFIKKEPPEELKLASFIFRSQYPCRRSNFSSLRWSWSGMSNCIQTWEQWM